MTDDVQSNRKAVYGELCNSYRSIDDFRTKLLGFLPLATGTLASLLLGNIGTGGTNTTTHLGPIGVFGFITTLGLFSYEIHAIKKCDRLIKTGVHLEDLLETHGQFKSRPHGAIRDTLINEPFAASIIYSAVLAAWAFLALRFALPEPNLGAPVVALIVFILFFAGSFALSRSFKSEHWPP